MEEILRTVPGVIDTVVGYAGGGAALHSYSLRVFRIVGEPLGSCE